MSSKNDVKDQSKKKDDGTTKRDKIDWYKF